MHHILTHLFIINVYIKYHNVILVRVVGISFKYLMSHFDVFIMYMDIKWEIFMSDFENI